VIALADYLYQRSAVDTAAHDGAGGARRFKQMEGDPPSRAASVSAQRAQPPPHDGQRANATCSSPTTHFRLALKYGQVDAGAALRRQGRDDIALKIREIARDHDVPIVENPPLARALFRRSISTRRSRRAFQGRGAGHRFVLQLNKKGPWRA